MADWLANYTMDQGRSTMLELTAETEAHGMEKGVKLHLVEYMRKWDEEHAQGR